MSRRRPAFSVGAGLDDPGFDDKVRLMEQWRRQYGAPAVTAR